MPEIQIGTVSTFFVKPMVAGIALTANLKKGDLLRIRGYTTDFTVSATSIQANNVEIDTAKKGHEVGIKVPDRVRAGDKVYKVTGA